MSHWLDSRVTEIRERMTSNDESSLWTLFFDDPEGEPTVASVIDAAMDDVDLELTCGLAAVTASVGATAALFAVTRRDGQPRPEDRQLWRDLQALLRGCPSQVLGFVVVGATSYWCATDDEAPSAA